MCIRDSLASVRWVRAADAVLCAEAGCTITAVHRAAAEVGLAFPLSFGAEGSAQLGGALATNAGGTEVLRHGTTRELVLGVEAVLVDGTVVDTLRSVRKDNTGYDLAQLLVGAEGTLGVITAASVRLVPAPVRRVVGMAAVDSVADAIALLARLRATTDGRLTSFELVAAASLDLVTRRLEGARSPFASTPVWSVLFEATSAVDDDALERTVESALAAALTAGEVADATLADSADRAAALWHLREAVPEAELAAGGSVKHDVSVPLEHWAGFVEALPRADGVRWSVFGHLGDANLHVNAVGAAALADEAASSASVYALVAGLGGSFSAEHGVGRTKTAELARYGDPGALAAMTAIKAAREPHGLMNPGVVLGSSA
mgnify:CR=1 FL=1